MEKTKLTIQDVSNDLRRLSKKSFRGFIERLLVFVGVLLLIVFGTPHIEVTLYLFLTWLLLCCGEVVFLVQLIKRVKEIITFYKSYKNDKIIVKDKLISAEIQEDFYGKMYVKTYHLNFSGYGEYVIHAENYKWSSTFSMSAEGVYNYSNIGDEFYLVLSKPHTGKIIYAYNTKMFEME